MSELSVTFLGTSAAMPTEQRGLPATLIKHAGNRFLVDCGEGTQRQMIKYGGLRAPTAIFITHYHPDHDLGLPGLLASLNMMEYDGPSINVWGPSGIEGLRTLCQKAGGCPPWVNFLHMPVGSAVEYGKMTVTAYATDHDVQSQGYIFEEADRPGRFNVDRAIELGVPITEYKKLQNGEVVYGFPDRDNPYRTQDPIAVYPNQVVGKPRRGRKLVITGDTRPCKPTVWAAENADLLIHEATFTDANRERAQKVGHSTVYQATEIAHMAKAKRLALTHFSPRETVGDLLAEAASRADLATDGHTIDIKMIK